MYSSEAISFEIQIRNNEKKNKASHKHGYKKTLIGLLIALQHLVHWNKYVIILM